MPQAVRYIARRSLAPGHTEGAIYTINLYLTDKEQEPTLQADHAVSLTGRVYTTFHGTQVSWQCRTRPMALTDALVMREFLRSAQDGQVLLFDPYAWAGASPSYGRSCVLEKGRYSDTRSVKRGGDQTGDHFTFEFSLLEVP